MRVSRPATLSLRAVALLYLTALLLLPLGVVFVRTFEHGAGVAWSWMTTPAAISALWLSLTIAVIAVPLNTIFGVGCAMVLVRGKARGRAILDALIDLPFVVSPVIAGLALILVYGQNGWFGKWFAQQGIRIIYAPLGMILATIFVSLPLVVRAVAPVLEEIGTEQEQAAWTLGASAIETFRRITLPAIRWALAFGVVLTLARGLGEYGAVAVVSGRLIGQTQTATLFVEERFQNFDQPAAYAMAFLLAAMAVVVLLATNLLRPREGA